MFRRIQTSRACPWCGGRSGREAWFEAGHAYVRCDSCGGFFADLSEDVYEQARHNVWDDEATDSAAELFYGSARQLAHDAFLNQNPPFGDRRLLDVGSGLGYFLVRARAAGWEVRGIDTSEAWVRQANQRLGSEVVQRGSIAESSFTPGSFDLITAWDVVEHIFDPIAVLHRLRTLLAPGGRLFIRTPNLSYVYPVYGARRALLRHRVELGPTNHVVYFNSRTMRRALRQAGLAPIAWPVLVPPQVVLDPGRAQGTIASKTALAAKNAYARAARSLASITHGHLIASSDLDVMCAASDD
jgi:2-polyprenyl-3-methyl-5-hydroxy-6-metoxy-1,4-benzoquinol methylase